MKHDSNVKNNVDLSAFDNAPVISIRNLTKDYGEGKGIFDLTLDVNKGETIGYVGTNGSGKTTTIRNIMGFLKPTSGSVSVFGLDSWKNSMQIKQYVGYVPGEIAYPGVQTGNDFLKIQAEFWGIKDMSYANYLINRLQLDTGANLKRMSKGMKQKTAIVAALMNDPPILILDEPTTGLDPLMRESFMDILLEEKKKGKTIFMSSHIFEEVEETCDRVGLLKDGHLVDITDMSRITNNDLRTYNIEFFKAEEYKDFITKNFTFERLIPEHNRVVINVKDEDVNKMFNALTSYSVKFISETKYTLDKYFDSVFEKGANNDK
mgnify:FL=1